MISYKGHFLRRLPQGIYANMGGLSLGPFDHYSEAEEAIDAHETTETQLVEALKELLTQSEPNSRFESWMAAKRKAVKALKEAGHNWP